MVSMGTNGSKGANATCSWTPWGWWWPGRVEAANVSDRRVGARLLAGLQSGFPWIRTVMADAGYESRKLARELKRRHGWRLHITKRRQRAFKVVGLTWIVERTFAWLSQKSSLEQRLRVEGPNFGSLHRPGGHPPHAQTARPEVGRPAAYSVWQIFGADE